MNDVVICTPSCRTIETLQIYSEVREDCALAYVYCDYATREKMTATNLVAALLAQLVNSLPDEHDIVKELLHRQNNNRLLDFNTTLNILRRTIEFGRFTCVRLCADGLDELLREHRVKFLSAMGHLLEYQNVSLLLFARTNSGIRSDVDQAFHCSTGFYELTNNMSSNDRKLYLEQCLLMDTFHDLVNEDLKERIFSILASPEST
jgi:hypothetical protein